MSVCQSIGRTTSFLVYQRPYLRIRTATTDLGLFRGAKPAHPLRGDGVVLALDRDMLECTGRFVEKPREALSRQYLAAARV